jgi:hypothetical protein
MTGLRSIRGALLLAIAASCLLVGSADAGLSASVAAFSLPTTTFLHSQQATSGTMTLTATDTGPVPLGWNVTIQASAFVYSGLYSGSNISAANFSLTSAAAPLFVSGQAIDPTNGPKVPSASPLGALNVARKVLQANTLYGVGTYTQALGVSLIIPAQARAGTYTSTLTTTIAIGP